MVVAAALTVAAAAGEGGQEGKLSAPAVSLGDLLRGGSREASEYRVRHFGRGGDDDDDSEEFPVSG